MADAMVDESSGHCSRVAGDCGSAASVPYFISFQIVGSFIFLNLVVAVILENFAKLHNVDTKLVSASDLELFSEAWAIYDPDADNYIPVTDVPDLLLLLPRPLGLKGKSKRQAVKLCMLLDLQTRNGEVAFADLLQEIVNNNYVQSGADLEELKEVVPGVVVPPVKIGGGLQPRRPLAEEVAAVSLNLIFSQKVFEQPHVKAMFLRMLGRARQRIEARGGPADPATYIQVYVKGGFANLVGQVNTPSPGASFSADDAARACTDDVYSTPVGAPNDDYVVGAGTYLSPPSAAEGHHSLGAVTALLKAASSIAAERLAAAKAEKARDFAMMSRELGSLEGELASQAVAEWTATLEVDEDVIRRFESQLARIDEMRTRIAATTRRQREAAQHYAELQRHTDVLSLARERLNTAQSTASRSEAEAVRAHEQLVRDGAYAELEALYSELHPSTLQGYRSHHRNRQASPTRRYTTFLHRLASAKSPASKAAPRFGDHERTSTPGSRVVFV